MTDQEPVMDYPEHFRTYALFLAIAKWGVISVVIVLVLLGLVFL